MKNWFYRNLDYILKINVFIIAILMGLFLVIFNIDYFWFDIKWF